MAPGARGWRSRSGWSGRNRRVAARAGGSPRRDAVSALRRRLPGKPLGSRAGGRQGGLEVIHRTCPPASAAPRAARHSPAWNSPAGRRGSPRPRSRRHRGSHRCCCSPNPAGWGRTVSAGWRRRGGGLPPSPPPARGEEAQETRFVLDLFGQRVEIGCHVLPPGSGFRDTTARGRSAVRPGAAIIARTGAGMARSLADARARGDCLGVPMPASTRASR